MEDDEDIQAAEVTRSSKGRPDRMTGVGNSGEEMIKMILKTRAVKSQDCNILSEEGRAVQVFGSHWVRCVLPTFNLSQRHQEEFSFTSLETTEK